MDKISIAKEGYPFIGLGAGVTVLSYLLLPSFITCLILIITLWMVYFFRDPERFASGDENDIMCPADGRVIAIEKVTETYFHNQEAIKISVFMNVFNVHVNRAPLAGQVTQTKYIKGKFFPADMDKASTDNERFAYSLKSNIHNQEIVVVQVAGLVARRIVNYLHKGQELSRTERFGLIRFGSRVDIYLPIETEIKVVIGSTTIAGETILGRI